MFGPHANKWKWVRKEMSRNGGSNNSSWRRWEKMRKREFSYWSEKAILARVLIVILTSNTLNFHPPRSQFSTASTRANKSHSRSSNWQMVNCRHFSVMLRSTGWWFKINYYRRRSIIPIVNALSFFPFSPVHSYLTVGSSAPSPSVHRQTVYFWKLWEQRATTARLN